MKVVVESELPCSADAAWDEVRRSRLLCEVCAPVVAFRQRLGEEFPERWPEGGELHVRSYLFGIIPLGTRTIQFLRVDPVAREIASHEFDPIVTRWDHTISIRPLPNGRCRYRDEVEVSAGVLTPLVWLFAKCLYRHRQQRWRTVAKRLAMA